jgi:hypothetical protein
VRPDEIDGQQDGETRHDQLTAGQHDQAAVVQVGERGRPPRPAGPQVGRERYGRQEHERGPHGEVHRHHDQQQQEASHPGYRPLERLGADDRQEIQVTGHQVGSMLGIVHGLAGQHEVHQRRQVRDDDHGRVEGHGNGRPGHGGDGRRPEHPLDPRVDRVAGGVQEQDDGPAEHEQRRGRHDQQQVLHHVRAEQNVIVSAGAALDGDRDDRQPEQERQRPAPGPRAGRVPSADSPRTDQVRSAGHGERRGDQRRELPDGQRVTHGQRRQGHSVVVMADPPLAVTKAIPVI